VSTRPATSVRTTLARSLGRVVATVFAGDRRVWQIAALCAVPLALLIGFYCLQERNYNTGTDNVEVHGYVARATAGQPVCIGGLLIPAGTARVRFRVLTRARQRPPLHMTLELFGRVVHSNLSPVPEKGGRATSAVFAIPELPAHPSASQASVCLTADGTVSYGGTALPAPPVSFPPTVGGTPVSARIAVWYLPPRGVKQSYLSAASAILGRASLFRPGWVGPWLYVLLLLAVLPALAFLTVRCVALAVDGVRSRRLAAWLFTIAAVNFICWSLITPPFQAPDEVDHFAYAQSLIERGTRPSRDPRSPLARWSSSELVALEGISYATDHQAADSRPPWLAQQERIYEARVASLHPRADDGGGNETAAAHGPIYYAALAPAYALAGTSPFSQLTAMRVLSALMGALTVLFTFLLARELAPGRPWLGVVAALLVAYEPMYGFISGTVNNDVGVNAGAAALELLLIRMLRRGITVPTAALTGVLLVALPFVKGTALSLYPVAALVLIAVLWRHHARADTRAWIALAAGAVLMGVLSIALGGLHAASAPAGSSVVGANATAVGGALGDIPGFLSYLWQVFLPRLPFMARHFSGSVYPAWSIFVVRGWAAFGSYTVAFPTWVYDVILSVMIAAVPLWGWAARMEWTWVRNHRLELLVLVAMPVLVIVGFEAAYYTPTPRAVIAEVGRYAFPAIGPLALLVVGALHAFGRRRMLGVAVGLLVAMIALSYASQLLTLGSFYA
jgi:Predicted membrane protein (DUF2142)